jgi:hypothetical protein
MVKVGDLVFVHGQNEIFIVRGFSENPSMAEIQLFNVSKQQAMDYRMSVRRSFAIQRGCQPSRCQDRKRSDRRPLVVFPDSSANDVQPEIFRSIIFKESFKSSVRAVTGGDTFGANPWAACSSRLGQTGT